MCVAEVQQFSCTSDESTAVICSQALTTVDAFSGKVLRRCEAPWDIVVGMDVVLGCQSGSECRLNKAFVIYFIINMHVLF